MPNEPSRGGPPAGHARVARLRERRVEKHNDGRDAVLVVRLEVADVPEGMSPTRAQTADADQGATVVEVEDVRINLDAFPDLTQERAQSMVDARRAALLNRVGNLARINPDALA